MNADALSRLPACNVETSNEDPSIFHFSLIDELPVKAEEIATATRNDPLLSRAYEYTMSGWPQDFDEELKPYANRRDELSCECGILLWGLRVCVPVSLHKRVLSELHDQHQGITRMKSLARGYFWWAKLDADIEQVAKECNICASVKNRPAPAPLYPWKWATRRFERVHLDFATKDGKNFLVLKDAFSKWIDVIIMNNITSASLIEVLRPIFAANGFPELLVTDNGPAFIAADFERFCKLNGIAHKLTPPYHPASNGAAERSVQILKQALATSKDSGLTLQHRVANFLLVYRNTPHATTGRTPSELFLKCQPRIRLSLMKPSLSKVVERKQAKSKEAHDGKIGLREFFPGNMVMVQNFRGKEKWVQGEVVQRLGPLTYVVKCGEQYRYMHIDHLSKGPNTQTEHSNLSLTDPVMVPVPEIAPGIGVVPPEPEPDLEIPAVVANQPQNAEIGNNAKRYPSRARKPPDRLDL
jgi:hypothetical protein